MPFSTAIRKQLWTEAGYRCCDPRCGVLVAEPSGDIKGIGEGAHIVGEKPGSARYGQQSPEWDRNVASNGLLLCRNCHGQADADKNGLEYSVQLLLDWKAAARQRAQQDMEPGRMQHFERAVSMAEELPRAQRFLERHRPVRDAIWAIFFNHRPAVDRGSPEILNLSHAMQFAEPQPLAAPGRFGPGRPEDFCFSAKFNAHQQGIVDQIEIIRRGIGMFGPPLNMATDAARRAVSLEGQLLQEYMRRFGAFSDLVNNPATWIGGLSGR